MRVLAVVLLLSAVLAQGAGARVELVAPARYRARVVDSHRGKILVVNFWATWCEPCRKEMPALLSVARDLSPRGVDLALVSADFRDASAAVSRYLDSVKASVPAFLEDSPDPAAFIDAVDPKWGGELPHTVVYSRGGKMRLSISETLTEARLRSLLAGVLEEHGAGRGKTR